MSDARWYQDAIIYELQLRSFFDSDGDGLGDLPGLTAKLDYLQDLGVTAIWLLPFYPSPLKDDGYDISDYMQVDPKLGSLRDLKTFLREAHRRGLKVITELVLNHTSDQHPWFQRARRAAPGTPERDFYVWSDTPDKYRGVRIIFKDFEASNWSWDPVARAYYWHRFFSSQPDLNFDHPPVQDALLEVVDYWFGLGVDGLRLDAVPYLFEREGTNCENLPETHAFLKRLRAHVDARFPDRMLLAEANQWPEDALAYFGQGDECHMAYHFPVMPRLYVAIAQEDRFPIVDILEQTPAIPPGCQWALFLRNHDELTLEMVTDRERDYMYRVYAQETRARINLGIRRRLAPLLGGHRGKIELMHALLLSLPGTPIVYYGDEIGMGDNIYLGDRNGVRTPMQWSADKNAGFSRANPQRLHLPVIIDPQYHYEAWNVELQQQSAASLLWWFKRILALRKRYGAFGRGSLELLHPQNRKVLAFLRLLPGQTLLCVFNLSRHVQHVSLDLHRQRGLVPLEILGQSSFPAVEDGLYPLTLGPYAFLWFSLEEPRAGRTGGTARISAEALTPLPGEHDPAEWFRTVSQEPTRSPLLRALRRFLAARGLEPPGEALALREWLALEGRHGAVVLALLDLEEEPGSPLTCQVSLGLARAVEAERLEREQPGAVVARVALSGGEEGLLHEATAEPHHCRTLLEAFLRRKGTRGFTGRLSGELTLLRAALEREEEGVRAVLHEHSNPVLIFGDRWLLKLYRRVEPGLHPEEELLRAARAEGFTQVPEPVGQLTYENAHEPAALALLQRFQPSEGDAWSYTLDTLGSLLERVLTRAEPPPPLEPAGQAWWEPPLPEQAWELLGHFLGDVRTLGSRAAELHQALARGTSSELAPEPVGSHTLRSDYQALRHLVGRVLRALGEAELPPGEEATAAAELAGRRQDLLDAFQGLLQLPQGWSKIRCHGHLHLGQVLYTGRDFVFTDFEGPAHLPLSARRHRRSALYDLASLITSLQAAGAVALRRKSVRVEDRAALAPWVAAWERWSCSTLVRAYLETAGAASFLPAEASARGRLLRLHALEHLLEEADHDLPDARSRHRLPLRLGALLGWLGSSAPARG